MVAGPAWPVVATTPGACACRGGCRKRVARSTRFTSTTPPAQHGTTRAGAAAPRRPEWRRDATAGGPQAMGQEQCIFSDQLSSHLRSGMRFIPWRCFSPPVRRSNRFFAFICGLPDFVDHHARPVSLPAFCLLDRVEQSWPLAMAVQIPRRCKMR
jgi:hypothetical protein